VAGDGHAGRAGQDHRARLGLTGALGTVSEVEDGRYTGRLVGEPLHGPAKAEAVRALAEREGLDLSRCTAYSDSANDVPLLSAVGHAVAVNPDRALREQARALGWQVRDFRTGRKAAKIGVPGGGRSGGAGRQRGRRTGTGAPAGRPRPGARRCLSGSRPAAAPPRADDRQKDPCEVERQAGPGGGGPSDDHLGPCRISDDHQEGCLGSAALRRRRTGAAAAASTASTGSSRAPGR
jgi:hypothetical protein